MIGWSTIGPGLRNLFSQMASDTVYTPEFRAFWAEGNQEMIHPGVGMKLTLKVTSIVGDGLDELRYEDVVANGETQLREYVVGHRRFTLQCRVESQFHGIEPDNQSGWCWTMTERLRTSIRRSRFRQALVDMNLSLIDIFPATDVSFTEDKRRINAAVCDYQFYAAFCDLDPIPLDWIERIELTSLVKNVDGETFPEPPNYSNRLIPPLPDSEP